MKFCKYHGAGNDFIVIDDRACTVSLDIPSLCHRHFGIGADGVILLQSSSTADLSMRIFNADGSEPAMCGNGLRCLVHFIKKLGLQTGDSIRIETGAGIMKCSWVSDRIAVHHGTPMVTHRHFILPLGQESVELHVLNTGVPHGVIFTEEISKGNFEEWAREIRFHPLFSPEGMNVNIACRLSFDTFAIRTYERGVEKETLSCGTGTAAVGWMAHELFALPSMTIQTAVREGKGMRDFEVVISSQKELTLTGAVHLVFEGEIQSSSSHTHQPNSFFE